MLHLMPSAPTMLVIRLPASACAAASSHRTAPTEASREEIRAYCSKHASQVITFLGILAPAMRRP